MAVADYSYVESSQPLYFKSNSSELYETCGRRNMGVLVTGPWPMSQPIYDQPSSVSVSLPSSCSRRSVRQSKDCLSCHHHQQQYHHHHHPQALHHHHCEASVQNVRPFSVPPSLGMLSGSLSCADSNHMELMPLNCNSQPAIPCRATLNELHPVSPPTCVPWLKKMKVIKKIQRKIGIDPRAQLNNSRSNVSEVQISHSPSTSVQPEPVPLPVSSPPSPQNDPYKLTGSAVLKVMAKFPSLVLNVDHFNPITKGKHAVVLGSVGRRREGEYSNAYLFPNQPLRPGETLVVCVQEVDYAYASSMAFGLTSCNPKEISHVGFPNDAYRLLDRPEYWVVEKDVPNSPPEGAVIGFTLTPEGEVIMKKNDETPKLLMHVDNSVPLYPFFDLYGTTTQIQLAGIVPASYYRPRLPAENARCRGELPRSSSMLASASPYTSLIRNVPHSVSAANCSPVKVGASSSSSAASLAAMSANEKNMATYATLNKKVSGPSLSPAPSRDAPNWCVECVACCERPVDSVFYSCGHMCMCYQCAVEYWKTKEKGCCPICRATISDVIRTYKS